VPERVLILDAHLRHAVAIVRSLGRRGVPLVVASAQQRFAARYSRYVERWVRLSSDDGPDPLLKAISDHRVGSLIAAGLPGNELLCRYSELLRPHVRAPFNDLTEFERLADKNQTAALADDLDVRRPLARQLRGPEDVSEIALSLKFPVVFKSPLGQGTVRYANDTAALRRLVERFTSDHSDLCARGVYPLVQEYIDGVGHGFYGLADHGRLLAHFMHRRLHEVPPSGGPSAMAMSWRDPDLLEFGSRFFTATSWHGVAMVEFKRSRRDGELYLIEVNPKFWGSLDLSIHAGVDFPWLLYNLLAAEHLPITAGAYRDGVIFRSLTMDLAYSVAARRLRTYARCFFDKRIEDDFDHRDVLPNVILFADGLSRGRHFVA
jgi:predicted ATP-grasp superfamily ATP-dependent carboligase